MAWQSLANNSLDNPQQDGAYGCMRPRPSMVEDAHTAAPTDPSIAFDAAAAPIRVIGFRSVPKNGHCTQGSWWFGGSICPRTYYYSTPAAGRQPPRHCMHEYWSMMIPFPPCGMVRSGLLDRPAASFFQFLPNFVLLVISFAGPSRAAQFAWLAH